MKNKLVGIFLTGFLLLPSMASQSVLLPELSRPSVIEASQNRLYIVDGASVLIYSLKDLKLEKKFGRRGEGPQEFKYITSLSISRDILLVNGRNKVSFYSKDGNFKKEIKITGGSDFIQLEDQFIGMDMIRVEKISHITVNLYDGNFKKIKEISRHKGLYLGSKHLDPILIYGPLGPEYQTWNNNILVKSSHGTLKIMSTDGTLLSILSLENEKVNLTSEHKEKILEFYRTNPRTKKNYPALKQRFKFPDYFPPIRNYHTDGDRLYILTFKSKSGNKEILVYDGSYKRINRIYLPVKEAHIMEIYPYVINNSTLYQVVEGHDDWSLVMTTINK